MHIYVYKNIFSSLKQDIARLEKERDEAVSKATAQKALLAKVCEQLVCKHFCVYIVCVCVCVYIYIYICMYVLHVYIYIYIYIYIHMHIY